VTVVIVQQDLLDQVPSRAPAVLDYGRQSAQGSMLNTPATYPWYLLGAVLEWLEAAGGVPFMDQESTRKSEFLYAAIDASALYRNDIEAVARSRMNIPFRLVEPQLESLFLKEARERGLVNLEGHRSVGGLRASLYNAMPYEGVVALVGFMRDFEARHG
jgi:phosphoserine aminotransferase